MRRGEIWWGELPERKRRPYLILTRDAAIEALTSVVVAPVTGTIRSIPTEVRLGLDEGLPRPCVAALDSLESLPKWALRDRVGAVSDRRLEEVCLALRLAVDC